MVRKKIILSLFIGILAAQFLTAQFTGFRKLEDAQKRFEQSFEVVMNPFAEDSLGNLWIASKAGLCKYTGSATICHEHERGNDNSISSNDIEGMLMDSQNRIWLACNGVGVDVLDLQGNKLIHLEHQANDETSLLSNRVWGIFEDDLGFVWISYVEGGISAYSIKEETLEHFDLDSIVSDTTFLARTVGYYSKHDSETNVFWLSTTNGLVKWNTKTRTGNSYLFFSEYEKEGLDSEHNQKLLSSNHQRVMYKDQDGILWMGSFGGLVRFDPRTETHMVFFSGYDNLIRNTIGIERFDENNLMISTLNGLLLFNRITFELEKLSEKYTNGGDSYLFGRMYRSTNGCTYLASTSLRKGIFQWCEQHQLFPKTFVPANTHEVIETKNYLHYSVKKGIVSQNLETKESTIHLFSTIKPSMIKALHYIGGDSLLIGTVLDAFYYHPSFGIKEIPALKKEGLYRYESILLDSHGKIWTGRQRQGIFTYDLITKKEEFILKENNQLPHNDYIDGLFEDSENDVWISTDMGWSMYDRSADSFRVYSPATIEKEFGVSIKAIKTIREMPDGLFWIVTNQEGIIMWDKDKNHLEEFLPYDEKFRFDGAFDAELDQEGNLWLVNASREVAMVKYHTQETKIFDRTFGFTGPMYSINSSPSGKMLIGSPSGYYEFDPSIVDKYQSTPPKPIIDGFSIFDVNQDTLLHKPSIELEHDQDYFAFTVSSLNYQTPEREIYEVKLTPFDENWQQLGDKRYKGYTNIPANDYEFQVRITTDQEKWQYSEPISLKIEEIWYNTWLFKILLFLVAGTAVLLFFNRRKKNAIKAAEIEKQMTNLNMKALRSQMNPHFLFNSLNSIRYQILSNDKQKAADYLTKFSRLVRIILENSEEDFVPISDELYLMKLYVEMEQIRFVDKFDFKMKIDPLINQKQVKIPPMIIQPFLENSIIHGINPLEKMGLILLNIELVDDRIHVIIEDNGIGITASKALKSETSYKKSMGMNITTKRITILLDSVSSDKKLVTEIRDKNGKVCGTKVAFNLPINDS